MYTKSTLVCVCLLICFTGFSQSKIDICNKGEILLILDQVEKDPKEILTNASDDVCVLEFLDTLTHCFIATGEYRYLNVLEAVCNVSDGYVSEYFIEITQTLVNENFAAYTNYLSNGNRCLEVLLLEATTVYGDVKKEELFHWIDLELSKTETTTGKKEYLKNLKLKVDGK